MAIYRFRIEVEDLEGVLREIEIKSTQTFEDLHFAILKAYAFDIKHLASFFYSDDLWHMESEIAFNISAFEPVSNAQAMNKARICEFIEDPHQRFLYVYFSDEETFTFQVELVDINTSDKPITGLPLLVRSVGEAPKQYKSRIIIKPKKDETPVVAPLPELDDEVDIPEVDIPDTTAAEATIDVFESFEVNDKAMRSKGLSDLDLGDDLLDDEKEKDEFDDEDEDDADNEDDSEDDDDYGSGKGRQSGRRSSDYDDDY